MKMDTVGAVVIGRNEGQRVVRCLQSLRDRVAWCVYVDSGSSDDSVAQARALGAEVVNLDMALPFTAARARNEGLARLRQIAPAVALVQFVDGDCELQPDWLDHACAFLAEHPEVAVVCGRRRERFPHASVYNQMCDLEWDTPIGPARACGGDALMRVSALTAVGGYRPDLIAGEEPELCVRLRAAGHSIWRLNIEMTLHDAAMHRLGQWWQRNRRSGHAFAEGAWLHGAPPERHFVAETRRALVWGAWLPLLWLGLVVVGAGFLAGLLLCIYPLQMARVARRVGAIWPGHPMPWRHAGFLILGRFPEAQGALTFYWRRWRPGPVRLIEYK
jgi:glycosyltransferase involved in cell wall biosynthesis